MAGLRFRTLSGAPESPCGLLQRGRGRQGLPRNKQTLHNKTRNHQSPSSLCFPEHLPGALLTPFLPTGQAASPGLPHWSGRHWDKFRHSHSTGPASDFGCAIWSKLLSTNKFGHWELEIPKHFLLLSPRLSCISALGFQVEVGRL